MDMVENRSSQQASGGGIMRRAALTVPLILLLGFGSGRLSDSGYGNMWFDALTKPAIMPPGWAFGAAWSVLYILMGITLAIVLDPRFTRGRGIAIGLFAIQLVLNLAWSPLFFALHEIMVAFWLILAILVMVSATAIAFYRVRPVAGLLLLPYLAWLAFAATLNWQFHELNGETRSGMVLAALGPLPR